MRLRHEDGASAVEFALIAPLLFMLLFGIIGFGLAFLRVQSIRTAVREGGRTAAVGAPVATTQQKRFRPRPDTSRAISRVGSPSARRSPAGAPRTISATTSP